MSVIPCQRSSQLRKQIVEFAETLKTEAHTLGEHDIDEREFYDSGLFRGAIERLRGQFAASMGEKREVGSARPQSHGGSEAHRQLGPRR